MASAQLDLKDLELPEGFLDTKFEEFQGFPWDAGSLAAGNSGPDFFSTAVPSSAQLAAADFSFDPRAQQPPLLQSGVPQDHRLLNDNGLAYTLPDLTTGIGAVQSGQAPYGSLLGAQFEPRATTPDSNTQQQECNQKPQRSTSGELGVAGARGKSALSLAERNKQAQRRHRQRQRERMEQLESQVAKLNEEKQALTAEKAALAGQAAVLTQVLQMRDEQLQQAQATPSATPSMSTISGGTVKEEPTEDFARRESAVSSGLAGSLASILTLTVREEQQIHLRPEQVKAMTPQEVARMWAEYMSALMKQLTVAQSSAGSPEAAGRAENRISELLQEVLVLLMRYALGDLHKMKQFVVGKASQAQPPVGLDNSEMWRAAARNLDLTDSQRRALCQLRLLFMQKQDSLIAQRREAMAALQQTIPNAASSHDIAAQFLKAEEAMGRLHENLRMENQLIVDLIYTLLVKIASPIQAAKCLVQSFPWYPDSLCIITWVAAEAGDVDAAELLQYKPPTVDQHSEQDSAGNVSDSPSRSP